MAYKRTGFVVQPWATYLPQYATDLVNTFEKEGATVETVAKDIADKLNRSGARRLNVVVFPELLALNTDAVKAGSDTLRQVVHVITGLLRHAGFMEETLPLIEYRQDPILSIDELATLCLMQHSPFLTRDELGGDFATVTNLSACLPVVLRRLMMLQSERALFVRKFRLWLGNIGYKALHGHAISQFEKTCLVLYADTSEGSPGFSRLEGPANIRAVEVQDPLILSAGAAAQKFSDAKNMFAFGQLLSNANLEGLHYAFGQFPSELVLSTGEMQAFGPFNLPKLQPADRAIWDGESQLAGCTERNDYLRWGSDAAARDRVQIKPSATTLPPTGRFVGRIGIVPDAPDINILVRDETNIAQQEISYYSKWKNRVVTTSGDNVSIEDYIDDIAVYTRSHGVTSPELVTLNDLPIADLTSETLLSKLRKVDGVRSTAKIALPNKETGALELRNVDITEMLFNRGTYVSLGAYSENAVMPRKWLFQPQEQALHFIAAREGLTNDVMERLTLPITISYNASRFERLTGSTLKLDILSLCRNVSGIR